LHCDASTQPIHFDETFIQRSHLHQKSQKAHVSLQNHFAIFKRLPWTNLWIQLNKNFAHAMKYIFTKPVSNRSYLAPTTRQNKKSMQKSLHVSINNKCCRPFSWKTPTDSCSSSQELSHHVIGFDQRFISRTRIFPTYLRIMAACNADTWSSRLAARS
jgi:hypothetical protein